MEKSKGQAVVERIAEWIGGYMSMSADYALLAALWSVHTWITERVDVTPYLVITARTKGAGKSRLMGLLSLVSRNSKQAADASPAAVYRLFEAYDSRLTIFFDEVERMSSGAASVMRSVMNAGYRQGQTVIRAKAGGGVEEMNVYGAKCFALIGDVYDTLRDRSIVLTLEQGNPARDFDSGAAEGEAAALVAELMDAFRVGGPVARRSVEWLSGRDREVWGTMFGVAECLRLDKAMTARLERLAADLVGAKTAPARKHVVLKDAEGEALSIKYGDMALRDLRAIFREGEAAVFSGVAVERMRAIATSPWRTFKGTGLDADALAKLVARFGVKPKNVRMVKGKGAKQAEMLKGYSVAMVKGGL